LDNLNGEKVLQDIFTLRMCIGFLGESGNYVIDTKWKILKQRKRSDNDLKQILAWFKTG
jgi:hypothetical protein